jgi:hypothetical protein
MISQGNDVPQNTVAIFTDAFDLESSIENRERLSSIISKPSKKRDWFTPHFYRCLPLTIGNQYGFIIKTEFDFSFVWDGGDRPESVKITFHEDNTKKYPVVESHFGSGIITINPPFTLRTPPGVNLMTINPPNHVIPNITVMTGVVETDNIRRNFTFNLKIQIPNLTVRIPKGTPLAAFIPIPRYYSDSFELKFAEDIFSDNVIIEENQAGSDSYLSRSEVELKVGNGTGKDYMFGKDVYGNKFKDHQKG